MEGGNAQTTPHHQQKSLIAHHQKATRTALVLQEASHYSPHWGGDCASSMCVEKSVGTAGVKLLEMQVPADLQTDEAEPHLGFRVPS